MSDAADEYNDDLPHGASAVERIARLESDARRTLKKVDGIDDRLEKIEGLLLQGRGAMRLAWVIGGVVLFFFGGLAKHKIEEFFRWLGS